MRLRLFGRKRRARKRAAAGGGVPAQTDLGPRPPVPVGSHRRTGQFRAPGRDWLNLGERPESSDRPGPGGGAGPDSGPAASPRLASGTRPGSGPGPGPEVQPAVGGTGSPPWGARQTWADNPARQAAGRPATPGAGQGHLAGSLSPGHRVSGRQPRPDGLVPPPRPRPCGRRPRLRRDFRGTRSPRVTGRWPAGGTAAALSRSCTGSLPMARHRRRP